MQRTLAIAWLTWKAAFRYRLFLVVLVLLLGSVVALPLLIEDDGTARGFTQILITYTVTVITALLGLCTLWLACGTLARDVEECQMQVVAVKPIARWQIWIGKWLGLMSLNAVLLAVSGGSVYGLLLYRATKLPSDQQTVLRNEVLVARATAREDDPMPEIQKAAEAQFRKVLEEHPINAADVSEVQRQILEQAKAEYQVVPPGYERTWEIKLGSAAESLRGRPLQLRIKFNAADQSTSGTYGGLWEIPLPDRTKVWRSEVQSLAPGTFHEFQIPPDLIDPRGVLSIKFLNANRTALLFPIEDGLEVLYRQGGFGMNFVRGLGIIYCWMGLLATIGLAAGGFLSFPVAAFVSLGMLAISLSTGTLNSAVTEGTVAGWNAERGTRGSSPIDPVAIPVFRAALKIINLAKDFSPVDSLSTGRLISWGQLGAAVGQIIVLLGGLIALFGIYVFARRELATAQGTQ
jgi:hypothetical protein